jgi:hypothetical protein
MEDLMLRKQTILFSALIICSLIMIPAGHVQASATASPATKYEPDDTPAQAKSITNGTTQIRAIVPKKDVDWIKFQLTTQSAVVLETNGAYPADTRMRLFQSDLTELEINDDDGVGYYALIDRLCGEDPLPPGTYYIEIEEHLQNVEIPSYNLSFQASPCPSEVVDIFIGSLVEKQGSSLLAPNGSIRRSFPRMNKGPVKIVNTGGSSIIAAERLLYSVNGKGTSFSEIMAVPASQLDQVYWLPWYNNKSLNTQLRIANVSNSAATVHVSIGGAPAAGSPYRLPAGVSIRRSYPGVDKGPVKIQSNVPIVAGERIIYKVKGVDTSFTEMMAMPAGQVGKVYWLPWYNNKDLDTQLRIANVSGSPASVSVLIGGAPAPGSPFTIPAGASLRRNFPGIDKGPVKIESDQDIVAAERVIYKINKVPVSFSEMMALPNTLVNTTFWLPLYNNKDLDSQLRIANATGASATVQVFIGGQQMPGSPFTLPGGASVRRSFVGVNKGPVQIVSTGDIVVTVRTIYKVNKIPTSFSEMMALPDSLRDTTFWLPWYNTVELDSQLRIAMP